KSAVGNVMAGGNEAGADQVPDETARVAFMRKVYRRRRAIRASEQLPQIGRLAEMSGAFRRCADMQDRMTLAGETDARHRRPVIDQPDPGNGRRWQDRLAAGLVIEGDISRNDREIECPACFADALDGADEL